MQQSRKQKRVIALIKKVGGIFLEILFSSPGPQILPCDL